MTVRNTNAEWIALITSVHESLNVERKPCQVPPLSSADGAKGIAQMIDHTVLKLDTTPQMVDDLCNEARKESFKVGAFYFTSHAFSSISLLTFIPVKKELSVPKVGLRLWVLQRCKQNMVG